MSSTSIALPQDHVRALDTLRSRLAQLSTSITLLKQQLEHHETLPSWPSLQQNATSVEYNLRKVGETMTAHQQMFTMAHAYPLPSFPGNTQEHLLQMLLRKKLEPRAEDWIDEAVRQSKSTDARSPTTVLGPDGMRELWNWAGPLASGIAKELDEADVFRANFTLAERASGIEKVVTGIRRNLDTEDDDEDDEDEGEAGDVMDIDGDGARKAKQAAHQPESQALPPPIPLINLLAFASCGDLGQIVR